jgi:hypothetical protein
MFSDPGHPQEHDNARHPAPPRRTAPARDRLTREGLIGLGVMLGTLGMGWLFRLAPFG